MRIMTVLVLWGCLMASACNTSSKSSKTNDQYTELYAVWRLESLVTPSKTVTAAEMGNPTYEFTKDGKRIKKLMPAPDEVVAYTLKENEISYPGTKLPAVKIATLEAHKLVLKNETTEWTLVK